MSTPPYGEQSRPKDRPAQYPPGQPGYGAYPPGQPGGYPPGQPGGQYHQQGCNPYGQGGYGPGYGYGYAPPGQLAGWPIRVGASLLDSLLQFVPTVTGLVLSLVIDGDQQELGTGGALAMLGGFFVAFLVWVWNRVIQQGRTGQSFGKKVTGLKIVHAETGQLIGIGSTLGREFCSVLFNNICTLNVLWPLWDEKQQTWHDKVVNDVVIRL
ncbi:RDD family protein [Kribbella sp. NPDC049174]|uniref:RDD family protein n=1 Tax=Kribbella sp. NPDC049174 TaxID=3364112 RepID=UPI0037162DE7